MKFENVTIEKEANILYDGNITSRCIKFNDGSRKTLGIMLAGEYELTSIHESVIDIKMGELEVMLPAQEWKKIVGPSTFNVPANSKYKLKVHSLVDYCASFIKY